MGFLNKLIEFFSMPGKLVEKSKASAISNYEKAVKLTLEKSAPCRQRRYGMKNFDMT